MQWETHDAERRAQGEGLFVLTVVLCLAILASLKEMLQSYCSHVLRQPSHMTQFVGCLSQQKLLLFPGNVFFL